MPLGAKGYKGWELQNLHSPVRLQSSPFAALAASDRILVPVLDLHSYPIHDNVLLDRLVVGTVKPLDIGRGEGRTSWILNIGSCPRPTIKERESRWH